MITDAPDAPDAPEPPSFAHPRRRRSSAGRRAWRAAMRGCEVVVTAAVVATSLIGAAAAPWEVTLLVAPATAFFVGGLVAVMSTGFLGSPSARRVPVYGAVAGLLLVPFLAGLAALGDAGGALFLVLVVLGSLAAGERLARIAEGGKDYDDEALEEILSRLPTACLLLEWHATGDLLRSAADRGAAIRIRAMVLDELTRRDPAGVQDWLNSRDGSPDAYIRDDRDRAG